MTPLEEETIPDGKLFGLLVGLIEIRNVPPDKAATVVKDNEDVCHETVDEMVERYWGMVNDST